MTAEETESIQVFTNLDCDSSYKVVELTDGLMEFIEKESGPLYFKSSNDDSEAVLCTKDKTYEIKQRNHSNTLLVMTKDQTANSLNGYSLQPSIYELKPTKGSIDIDGIPIYDGQDSERIENNTNNISIDDLIKNSAISEKEFGSVWFNLNGSSINGTAVILSDDFITRSLHLLIMSVMASNMDLNELSLIDSYKSIDDEEYTIDLVETIIRKFSENDIEPYKLDKSKISKWYGIVALKKFTSKHPIEPSEFLIKWKSEFPPFFECSIDLSLLSGHFVRPLPDRVKYINEKYLSDDIVIRIKELFKLQSVWDLNELVPFIKKFNTKGLKHENFIMKYAKKKKVGKKFIITQR